VYVLIATAMGAALGLMVQGLRTLVTRRVPRLLVRIRGEAIARRPLRLGGFQLLSGAAVLMIETTFLPIPYGLGIVMLVAASAALVAAVVWYAARKS
jgi:hypothetical protein